MLTRCSALIPTCLTCLEERSSQTTWECEGETEDAGTTIQDSSFHTDYSVTKHLEAQCPHLQNGELTTILIKASNSTEN